MWFVLTVIVVVAAGWMTLAAKGRRDPVAGSDDSAPVNAYDNPFDTNENNDRPFEPDTCGDASDASDADVSDSCDSDGGTSD